MLRFTFVKKNGLHSVNESVFEKSLKALFPPFKYYLLKKCKTNYLSELKLYRVVFVH